MRTAGIWACAAIAWASGAQAQTVNESVIHSFGNFTTGCLPYGTLVRTSSGDIYGTTYQGGAANYGAIFRLTSGGYKLLYSFKGGADGAFPYAGVTLDSAGNIYGTTYFGGSSNAGTVYKVEPSGLETVLYSFTGGTDGSNPYAGVILDSGGNIYGTTFGGGTAKLGVVFKLTPSGQETVLHSFMGAPDGANPYAGLVADPQGNLYGTTYAGGSLQNAGVIYEVTTNGSELVLFTLGGDIDYTGGVPRAGMILDSAGNLYGTTSGTQSTIFKLSPAGKYTILYQENVNKYVSFESGLTMDSAGNIYGALTESSSAGAVYEFTTAGKFKQLYTLPPRATYPVDSNGPVAGVVLDPQGNIYGTTPYSGLDGIVYKLTPSLQETTLYSFSAAGGGTFPQEVVVAPSGDFYGTTFNGGTANAGTVFRMSASGAETVLHSFTGGADGAYPGGAIAVDSAGNVYGTTKNGGGESNAGIAYKVSATGVETILHTFTGGADGGIPTGGVVLDSARNVYGTTSSGGSGSLNGVQDGVVFMLDPAGNETVLYNFTGLSDGGTPDGWLLRDSAGNLYGTTFYGGLGAGVIYKVDITGKESVLYAFEGGDAGGDPVAGVTRDSAGNFYGTTVNGGTGSVGTAFELTATGTYKTLYNFPYYENGAGGVGGMVPDSEGNVYGAQQDGSSGLIYKIGADGQYLVLYNFPGPPNVEVPAWSVMLAPSGYFYGAGGGGALAGGTIYKISPQ